MQNSGLLVDFNGLLEIHGCIVIVFLLLVNVTESPPCIMVSFVAVDCFLVAFSGLLEVFIVDVLVAAQGVRIREIFVYLNGFTEILKRRLVFFLKCVAISQNAPSFWRVETTIHGIFGPVNEIGLLLEMPEAGRVILEALKSVGLLLHHGVVPNLRLLILSHLEVTFRNLLAHPSSHKLLPAQLLILSNGFFTIEVSLELVSDSELSEQTYQVR